MQALSLRNLTVGAMLTSLAGTSAMAQQSGTQPITFQWQETMALPSLRVTGDLVCTSPAHIIALKNDRRLRLKAVSLTDSAAAKKLIASQARTIWDSAGRKYQELLELESPRRAYEDSLKNPKTQPKGPKPEGAKPEELAATQKLLIELYNKLLPKVRALVPAAEQATFDQNLKQLQTTGYAPDNQVLAPNCEREEYASVVYGLAVRGITVADSAALNKLAFEQLKEIYQQASREGVAIDNNPKAATAEKETNRKLHRELFDKLLPQLRAAVPAGQQATFDQNFKVLQASNYTIVITNIPQNRNSTGSSAELDIKVGCFSWLACGLQSFP